MSTVKIQTEGKVEIVDKRNNISFVLIAMVIGFMIAIQFQTVKEPVIRDTRDTWELREDLMEEKELQSKLILEIRSNEEKLAKYESKRQQSKEQALRETLNELKKEAGLTEITGPGLVLTIGPEFEELIIGKPVLSISPDLLKRLINELNMYDAKDISINDRRIINTTVIRDINRETKIDGYPLNSFPIEIKVITENMEMAEKLYNRMQVSKAADDLYIESLRMSVSKPVEELTLPGYDDTIRVRYMEAVESDKGGSG